MSRTSDMMWPIIVLLSVCGLVQGLYRSDPLVSTKGGVIRGLTSDQGYSKFLGVPYAVVDKNNPFGASVPHPGFNDTFDAYESSACPQINSNTVFGTIDCLSVDVYVPSVASAKNRLPVMVWIHGGAFVTGSASTHPEALLKNDVIVVSINYRLGIYGFMCLDIPELPGNQGLKDQVLALRWINENIEAFGGDAQQITVFGESAGGMSVSLHLLSSYESLFQQAIIQSGPAFTELAMSVSNTTVPLVLAEALDFNTDDTLEALAYLASVDAHTLTQLAFDMKITTFAGVEYPIIGPCVEKDLDGVEHFMTEHPVNRVTDKARNTPVIIGHTNNEMPFMYGNAAADFFSNYKFDFGVIDAFDFGDNLENVLSKIRRFYIGDENVGENVKDQITDFASDFLFNHPTQRMAEKLLDLGAETVYRYIFSYSGGRNLVKVLFNLNSTGAIHADELGYLFEDDLFSGDPITVDDQLMIDRITTLWANFAKYGNPTPEVSDLLPVKWEPVTNTSLHYLNLDQDLTMEEKPFEARMAFWDVFYRLYKDQQKL